MGVSAPCALARAVTSALVAHCMKIQAASAFGACLLSARHEPPCRLIPGISPWPQSALVNRASSLGQSAGSTRPATLLLEGSSNAGKNSLQEISTPACPWANAADWPSQSHVVQAGFMYLPSSIMYRKPLTLASFT